MSAPKILAFAGSTRTDSFNKKLIKIAADGARAAGADVTLVDLRDFAMPLYDGDLEIKEGLPANAKKLKALFVSNDALLISTPEYNSSFPGVLKNAIDWVSRSETAAEAPLTAFANKTAALLSASPGALGGERSLASLRLMLGNIRVLVAPLHMTLPKAHEAFNPDGSLKDPKQKSQAEKVALVLVELTRKLKA